MKERTIFSINDAETIRYAYVKKKKKQLKHLPHTTFKLTQIVINLNVGIKIVKHLEENTGENLCNFKLDKDVLNMISKEKKAIIWT